MKKRLKKLTFWKFFNLQARLILCLFGLILVTGSVFFYYLQETVAYPFVEADEYEVLDDPRHAVEGDFNGDGKLDLAIVNFRASYVSIALNNGDGTFKPAVHYSSGGIGPLSVSAGDFDGDGDLDLAVVNYISNNVRLLINDGTGAFTPGAMYTGFNRPSAIVADYFNAGGVLDLAVTNAGSNNFSILLGDGLGGFSVLANFTAGIMPAQIISADLNNNGIKDLVVANNGIPSGSNSISIHLGNGNGTFGAPIYKTTGTYLARSIAVGDFDGDSDLDLAVVTVSSSASALRIFENDGAGGFTLLPASYALSSRSIGLAVGDYDNNGNFDAAVTNFTDNTISVLPGNGDLTFGARQNFNVGRGPIYLLSADFDADGKDDLITLNKGENNLTAFPYLPMNNTYSYLRNFYGVKIAQFDRNKFVSEAGLTDSYDVVLTSAPTNDVVITISYDPSQLDILPVGGILTFTSADWNVVQTVTISAVDDLAIEGDHFSLITQGAASLDPDFNGIKIPDVNAQIADNDQPGVAIYEPNGFTKVTEGGAVDTYLVVLNTAPTDDVLISINSTDQMTALPANLTFTSVNWDTPQTVTLTAVNDLYVEGLEIRNVTHSASSADLAYNGLAINNVSAIILDNNFLNYHPMCAGMMGDLAYNFQVNGLDREILNGMLLELIYRDFCGDIDNDFYIGAVDEDRLHSYILLNYYEIPQVVIVETDSSTNVEEGGATDEYWVYLKRRPSLDVIVSINPNSQLETDKSQLTFTNLNFSTVQKVTVSAVDDFYVEASPHSGTVTHAALSGDPFHNGLAVNSVTANITDNDTAGVIVTESAGSTLVNEEGETSDNIFYRLTSVPAADVVIDLTTPDGQTTVLPTQLTFTAGNWNIDQQVIVTAVDDDVYENTPHIGRVWGHLASADLNYDGKSGFVEVSITDNEVMPSLSIGNYTGVEGDSGTKIFNFAVTLSGKSAFETKVSYETADGTATIADNDYQYKTGTLIYSPGQTSKIIMILVNGDTKPEANETFYVNLSSPVNASIYDGQAIGTILDDDTAGITVSAISGSTTESGGTATFTVVLDRQPVGGPGTTVTIGLSSSDTSEGTVFPASLTFTRLNWNIPQTVIVTGVDDDVADGNISYIIYTDPAVCATDPNFNGLNPPDVAVINLDDEILSGQITVIAPQNAEPPCEALDLFANDMVTKAINWNFIDMSTDEIGFRLYEYILNSEKLIKEVAEVDINQIQESENLGVNRAYARVVKAYNNIGFSMPTEPATCYTLANIPKPLSIKEIGTETITVNLDPNDGNPPETKYAIRVISGTEINFVNPDGSFNPTETWHTYAEFGGDNGVVVTGAAPINVASVQMALTTDQNYSFSAKAKNGDDIETAYSDSVDTLAMAKLAITKGVGINLVKNSLGGLVRQAWAGNFLSNANSPLERILSVLSWLFNVILIILMIILAISLQQTLKYLKHKIKYPQTAALIWAILSKEAQYSYQNQAQPTEMGIYNKISYNWHKNLHNISQGTLILALATAGLKLLVMGVLLFSLITLNSSTLAQSLPYDQSNQPVVEGDILSYIIEVSNNGIVDAQDVIISDTLDSYLTYQTGSAGINYNSNNRTLTFDVGTLDINENVEIIFKATVNSGTEGQTIINQAQISGSNFADKNSAITSNQVQAAPINTNINQLIYPVCGNGIIETGEDCDLSDCAAGYECVNCVCELIIETNVNQNINQLIYPVCGNGIIETGEDCDLSDCAAGYECVNCACELIIETNVNQNINQPPTNGNENINRPPVIPPAIIWPPEIPIIGPIIEVFDNPNVENISQNIITPLLITVAAINTLPTLLMLTLYLLPFLHLIFLEPFLILFRKKREKWGVVYNSLTKLPLDLAVVRLYEKDNNRLMQTRVTDKDGRYLLIVKEPGKYYLTVTRPGYLSPSRYLQDEKQDLKYLDLYHGEAIEVSKQGTVITANIPLDPLDKKAVSLNEVIRSYFLKNLRLIISYLGIILALVVVLIIPTAITIAALIIHILLFLLFRKFIVPPKPKSWGIVYDEKSKQPLSLAVVRIFDLKFNKLLETQVTDSKGRYSFLVGNNMYQLLTEKTGYQKKETKPVDLVKKEQIVNLDIELAKQ